MKRDFGALKKINIKKLKLEYSTDILSMDISSMDILSMDISSMDISSMDISLIWTDRRHALDRSRVLNYDQSSLSAYQGSSFPVPDRRGPNPMQ